MWRRQSQRTKLFKVSARSGDLFIFQRGYKMSDKRTNDFTKIDGYLMDGLRAHVVNTRSLIEKPYFDEDGTFIEYLSIWTLDDGLELELCQWSSTEYAAWCQDISVDAALFDAAGIEGSFPKYLSSKGLPLYNVEDTLGQWQYCGLIRHKDIYRIQYYQNEEF